nr:hypothetical protein Iba_scaffold40257CG0520 [Ipomoea batatas]GMD13626.1 hypothetical protein Iba_chr07aCG14800 [Ipomoea batatas]GME14768.1 hypothetical protein Iba_scaffold15423CG0010 [Ipomoea batatas]
MMQSSPREKPLFTNSWAATPPPTITYRNAGVVADGSGDGWRLRERPTDFKKRREKFGDLA